MWHSLGEAEAALVVPGPGDITLLVEARVCGVGVPQKYWPCFSRVRVKVGRVFGLAKNVSRFRFPESFPTLLGLACPMP